MNGFIPDDKVEEIKKRTDIVELVSEYVTLKKAGRNFLGICPFHSEKTPSFTVNREKQMYYCFGCGEGGQIFTFLMKMSNMTFPEAARHLAKKTGVVIPERTMTQKERLQYGIREKINNINEMATVYFVSNIFSPAGQRARDYLKVRGISDDIVREFRLGYAGGGWRTLKNFFDQKHIPLEIIIQAGLVVSKNETDGEAGSYDRFRERLIFPIEDESGRVIAFGGRVIGNGEPKYLNSPETPVFSKGKNLYGLHRGKESIRKNGYAVLVEGYFDLIALWNVGITNVVATLGTALTKEQVELIRRYTGRIVVLFDPDEAGRKALERSLQLFLAGGLQTKVVVLPERYDPDDFVRKFGRKSLEEIISNAPSMVDYYVENIVGARATLEEKRDAVREALSFVSSLDDAIERNLFLKKISEKLGIDEEVLKREASRTLDMPSQETRTVEKTEVRFDRLEFSLILAMLEHPEMIAQIEEAMVLDYFLSEDLKKLGGNIMSFVKTRGGKAVASSFPDCLDNGPLKKLILRSLLDNSADNEGIMPRYVSDTIKQIKRKWCKRRNKALIKELLSAQEKGDSDLCSRLLLEKERLLQEEKLI